MSLVQSTHKPLRPIRPQPALAPKVSKGESQTTKPSPTEAKNIEARPEKRAKGERVAGSRIRASSSGGADQLKRRLALQADNGIGAKQKIRLRNAESTFVQQANKNFKEWDRNGNGLVEFSEIQKAVTKRSNKNQEAAALAVLDQLPGVEFSRGDLKVLEADYQNGGDRNLDLDLRARMAKINAFKAEKTLFDTDGLPAIDDISQGRQGDCYFLSALASKVAHDPQSIKDMMEKNDDGTYTVHFADGDVTVRAPSHAQVANGASSTGEGRWVEVMEFAYAKYKNQMMEKGERNIDPYDTIGAGGWMEKAMKDLGRVGEVHGVGSETRDLEVESTRQILQESTRRGDWMNAATWSSPAGLPTQHAYTITRYDRKSDTVFLRNPWGIVGGGDASVTNLGKGNFSMSLKDFVANFQQIVTA